MTAVLYILMRNDMASLNPGKAMAQASHASNAFVNHIEGYIQDANAKELTEKDKELQNAFNSWRFSTSQGFGTVLVLEGSWPDIKDATGRLFESNYIAGAVFDPTYPLVDGATVHYIPLHTCSYVFVPNKEMDSVARFYLSNFDLHR